jgi:hypothetical protein
LTGSEDQARFKQLFERGVNRVDPPRRPGELSTSTSRVDARAHPRSRARRVRRARLRGHHRARHLSARALQRERHELPLLFAFIDQAGHRSFFGRDLSDAAHAKRFRQAFVDAARLLLGFAAPRRSRKVTR